MQDAIDRYDVLSHIAVNGQSITTEEVMKLPCSDEFAEEVDKACAVGELVFENGEFRLTTFGLRGLATNHYGPSHPWYYHLGGEPLAPEKIEASKDEKYLVITVRDLIRDYKIPQSKGSEVKRREKLIAALKTEEGKLADAIESYNQLIKLGWGALRCEPEKPDPQVASSLDTSFSLSHNHIIFFRTNVEQLQRMLDELGSVSTVINKSDKPRQTRRKRKNDASETQSLVVKEDTSQPPMWLYTEAAQRAFLLNEGFRAAVVRADQTELGMQNTLLERGAEFIAVNSARVKKAIACDCNHESAYAKAKQQGLSVIHCFTCKHDVRFRLNGEPAWCENQKR
jgi:hypothetical protein